LDLSLVGFEGEVLSGVDLGYKWSVFEDWFGYVINVFSSKLFHALCCTHVLSLRPCGLVLNVANFFH